METRSVSPAITPPPPPPPDISKEEQDASSIQHTPENVIQSEDNLQETPEKKQKVSKPRPRGKPHKRTPSQKHKKSKASQELPPEVQSSAFSTNSAPPAQESPSSEHPPEPDTVVLLDDESGKSVRSIAKYVPVGEYSVETFSAANVVLQSDLSPAALTMWKDILKKEARLQDLAKRAEAVMAVLNSQIETCRSLGVDVLSVDHEISDLMAFKAINKKKMNV